MLTLTPAERRVLKRIHAAGQRGLRPVDAATTTAEATALEQLLAFGLIERPNGRSNWRLMDGAQHYATGNREE